MPETNNPPPNPNNPNPWEAALNEANVPKINELSVGNVLNYREQFKKRFRETRQEWGRKEVLDAIKRDIEFQDPIIRGGIEIARGEKQILVVNSEQVDTLYDVYGVGFTDIMFHKYYATVEKAGKNPEKTEAEVKFVSVKPKDINNFIVSNGLAKALEGDTASQIKILKVYMKPEDIDLDKM